MFKKSRESYPKYFISPKLECKESSIHGVGVFAKERIASRELIEGCPVILFHSDTLDTLAADGVDDEHQIRHVLMDYPFAWTTSTQLAFALGWGGIYNHSTKNPNATWKCNSENGSLDFYSRHVIEAGEEIFIRYLPIDESLNLWFVIDDIDDYDDHLDTGTDDWQDISKTIKVL